MMIALLHALMLCHFMFFSYQFVVTDFCPRLLGGNMVSVVYIGYYNKNGQFESDMWGAVLKWITTKCDNVQIYTQLEYSRVLNYIGNSGKIIQQEFPDRSLNYNSYKIVCQSDEFWANIKRANFDIDNGITHMYFFKGNVFIGELEVDDCENFVFLDISPLEESEVASIIPNISKNIKNCCIRKEQIDYLVNGEEWRPIGVS